VAGLTAQISVPPMIPFILYGSVKTGELVLNREVHITFSKMLSLQTLNNLYVYSVGACVLSVVAALVAWIITYLSLKLFRYRSVPAK
jgi:uncharacterized protein (DUF2062 family)